MQKDLKLLESYQRTERLTTLNRGGNSMNKNSLLTSIGDYRNMEILPGSIIYCDPPYRDTREYCKQTFDYESFYDWCEKQTAIVVISEYWMPEDRFVCIASRKRKSTFSATNNALEREEKLYVPKGQHERYLKLMNK